MDARLRHRSIRILVPRKERAKGKVLNNGELGENLCIEHLDHALVDLAPAVANARNVKENRAVLPEGACFDVVDEANGGKIHVGLALVFDNCGLGYVAGLGGAFDRALERHGVGVVDGTGELCGAKDVGNKRVVVETPDAVRAGWLESICQDEPSHNPQISAKLAKHTSRWKTYGSMTWSTISLSISPCTPSLKYPSFHRHPRKAIKLTS